MPASTQPTSTQPTSTQPTKTLPYQGVDQDPKDRPGAVREVAPHALPGSHWTEPERQPVEGTVLVRPDLKGPTPVFSTALPPQGVSGAIRKVAFRIPDHRVSHWLLLLFADRVDVVQRIATRAKNMY